MIGKEYWLIFFTIIIDFKRTHIHDMLETPLFENILKSLMVS